MFAVNNFEAYGLLSDAKEGMGFLDEKYPDADFSPYTYGEVLEKVYNADGAEDIAVIESWKYDAVRGRIYQDAYIYTGPLSDEEVYTLNEIFGIE